MKTHRAGFPGFQEDQRQKLRSPLVVEEALDQDHQEEVHDHLDRWVEGSQTWQ